MGYLLPKPIPTTKDKMLLVMYINIGTNSEANTAQYIKRLRNSEDIVSLKKTYQVLIMPVKNQDTKVEVFSREKIEQSEINLELNKLHELQELIK